VGPVGGADFPNRRLHVFVDGAFGDVQDLADFPSRFSASDPSQHLGFT
jgi:hypothetical protein